MKVEEIESHLFRKVRVRKPEPAGFYSWLSYVSRVKSSKQD